VPMIGVGFSFGGALLTTTVGNVTKEQHTLSAVVSVSGLFDFGVSAYKRLSHL
jgi:predicted alpha/beta-fold hydrolase